MFSKENLELKKFLKKHIANFIKQDRGHWCDSQDTQKKKKKFRLDKDDG